MRFKNAGIKSERELAKALLNGKEIYLDGYLLKFCEDCGCSPWRFGAEALVGEWKDFAKCEVKAEWYEDITKRVACKVWDDDPGLYRLAFVTDYKELDGRGMQFISESSWWKNAEPLTKEDLLDGGEQ